MILSDAQKSMVDARNLGFVLAGFFVVRTIILLLGGTPNVLFSAFDIVLVLAMAYGVHRKMRVAAIGLLAYYVLNLLLILFSVNSIIGLLIPLALAPIFIRYFVLGVRGTNAYHKIMAEKVESKSSTDVLA